MKVRPVQSGDSPAWIAMRMALWPETDLDEHRKDIRLMLSDPDRFAVFVSEDSDGAPSGFVEVALRDWAEGCLSSPVGFQVAAKVVAFRKSLVPGRKSN